MPDQNYFSPEEMQNYLNQLRSSAAGQEQLSNDIDLMDKRDVFQKTMRASTFRGAPTYTSSRATAVNPNIKESERLGISYRPGSDTETDDFHKRQSTWEQLTNGAYRAFYNTLYDTVGGTAAMLDFEDYFNTDDEIGNEITRWADQKKKETREAAPIYQSSKTGMGDPSWWIANGADLVSSVAAFGLQGFGIGKGLQAVKWLANLNKMGSLTKAAMRGADAVQDVSKITDKGAKWYDKLTTAGVLDFGKSAGRFTENVITSAMLNQSEAIMSASQVYDDTYKKAINQGYDPEFAKQVAASAGSNVINLNRTNILLNLTSADMLLKGKNNIGNLIQKRTWGEFGKKVATEAVQEAAEEATNLFAEKQGTQYGQELINQQDYKIAEGTKPGSSGLDAKPIARGIDLSNPFGDATTQEIFETMFLGAIGGAGQTALIRGKDMLKGPFGTTEVARYSENQYYVDGSLKAKKGDVIYETQDATYKEDVVSDTGQVVHKKGDKIYKYSNEVDEEGNPIQEVTQELVLDKSGKPKALKIGEVDDKGNKIKDGKAKKFSMTELINYKAGEVENTLKPFIEHNEQFSRIMGGAKIQNQIEKTISDIDDLIVQGKSLSEDKRDAAYNQLATLELINEGKSSLTQEEINKKAEELKAQKLSEKDLRKKQDDLLDMSLAQKAVQAFELNGKDNLINVFKDVMAMDEKEAIEKGYGADYKKKAKESIDKIEEYYSRWREYNSKHSPQVARALFLNRLKRDNLGTEMTNLNREIEELHEKELERFAAEQGLNVNDLDTREKYNKAFELEKEKQQKLVNNKDLKKLNQEKEQLEKEMTILFNKDRSKDTKEQTAADKRQLDSLQKKLSDVNKDIKEKTDNIVNPINEEINKLGLRQVQSGIRNQAEVFKNKVELLENALKLDNEFDKLRSKKGDEELRRQEIENYRKGIQNQIYKQVIQQLLDIQKQNGSVLYTTEDGQYIKGKLERKDGKWVFVADQDSFIVPDDQLKDLKKLNPADRKKAKAIREKISELEKQKEKLTTEEEKFIKQELDKLTANLLDTSLSEQTKKTMEEWYKKDIETRKNQTANEIESIDDEIKTLEEEIESYQYYTITKGEEGTEDEDLNIATANPFEIEITFDELDNLEAIDEASTKLYNAKEQSRNLIYDKLARIERAKNSRLNEIDKIETDNKDLLEEYNNIIKEANKYQALLFMLSNDFDIRESFTKISDQNGNEVIIDIANTPEIAQLRAMQLEMQTYLTGFLEKEIQEELRSLSELEKEVNEIEERIKATDDYLLTQLGEWYDLTTRAERVDKETLEAVHKAGRNKDKNWAYAPKELAKMTRKERLAAVKGLKNEFNKGLPNRIESAVRDLEQLNKRKAELDEIASPEKIQQAKARINSLQNQLSLIKQTGFNTQIFKMISDINSLESKKKQIDSFRKTREVQLDALRSLLDKYAEHYINNPDEIANFKSLVAKRNYERVSFDNVLDSIMLNPNLSKDDKWKYIVPIRRMLGSILDSGASIVDNFEVDNLLKIAYDEKVISEDEYSKLLKSWTQVKQLSYSIEAYKDGYQEYDSYEDTDLFNILADIDESIKRLQSDYQKATDLIENIVMEQNKLGTFGTSSIVMFSPALVEKFLNNTVVSSDKKALTTVEEYEAELEKTLLNLEASTSRIDGLIQNKREYVDGLREQVNRLSIEINAITELRNASVEEINKLTANPATSEDLNAFIQKFSKDNQVKLISSIQEEIDTINDEINQLESTIALYETSIYENIEQWKGGNPFRDSREIYIDQTTDEYKRLVETRSIIKKLRQDLEDTQLRKTALESIYNFQKKVIEEVQPVTEESETSSETETEVKKEAETEVETKPKDKNLDEEEGLLEKLAAANDTNKLPLVTKLLKKLLKKKDGKFVNINQTFETEIGGEPVTYVFVKYNKNTLTFLKIVGDTETKITVSEKAIKKDSFDFLIGTKLGTEKYKAKEKEVKDKPLDLEKTRHFPEQNNDNLGDSSTEITPQGDKATIQESSDALVLSKLDAKRTIFTSAGSEVVWNNATNKREYEKGTTKLTKNKHELVWFDMLNKISNEADYKSKYQLKLLLTTHKDIKDLTTYNAAGESAGTYGEFAEKNGAGIVMVLVDQSGNYVKSDGKLVFVNFPKSVKNLTKEQQQEAATELAKSTGKKSFTPKEILAYHQNKLNDIRNNISELNNNGKDVIVPITYISPGHEFTTETASSANFQTLVKSGNVELKFGDKGVITEKTTRPNMLYLKIGNSHVETTGRNINEQDLSVLKKLFSNWATSATTLSNSIVVENEDKSTNPQNIFELINKVIYYDKPSDKSKSLDNYQMRIKDNKLFYKPHDGSERFISLDSLSKLESSTLTKEQEDFISFLKSMRRQVFKKQLAKVDKYLHPTVVGNKIIMKQYPSYKDYLLSTDSPLETKATLTPNGSPVVGRYVEFNPTSITPVVIKEVEETKVPTKPVEIKEEEYQFISEIGIWTAKSKNIGGEKISFVHFVRTTNGILDKSAKYPHSIVIYKNGKIVTDESEKLKYRNTLSEQEIKDAYSQKENGKVIATIYEPVTITLRGNNNPGNDDVLESNIKLNKEAGNNEILEDFNEIKKVIKPVEQPKTLPIEFKSFVESNKTVLNKYTPLINTMSFNGKVLVDPTLSKGGAAFDKSNNTIVVKSMSSDIDASNLVHEMVHAGTLNWLMDSKNHGTEEYKRLEKLHRLIFNKLFNSKWALEKIGNSNLTNLQYVLFGGMSNNMSTDALIKSITNNESNPDALYKALMGSANKQHLVELVTFIMSNKEFQEQLNKVTLTADEKEALGTKKKNLWDALVEIIGNVFGIKVGKDSLLKEAIESTADVMQNIDKKLATENEVKSSNRTEILNYLKQYIDAINNNSDNFNDDFKSISDEDLEANLLKFNEENKNASNTEQVSVNIKAQNSFVKEYKNLNKTNRGLVSKQLNKLLYELRNEGKITEVVYNAFYQESTRLSTYEPIKLDDNLAEAVLLVVENKSVSQSLLGRMLKLSGNRTSRLIEEMKQLGIIDDKQNLLINDLNDIKKLLPISSESTSDEPTTSALNKATDDAFLKYPSLARAIRKELEKLDTEEDKLNFLTNEIDQWSLDKDVPFSPFSSQVELETIAKSNSYKNFDSSIRQLYNTYEGLNQKDRIKSLETVLINTLNVSDNLSLLNKVIDNNPELYSRINGDNPKLTKYDIGYIMLSDLFDDYLNKIPVEKSIKDMFDQVTNFYNDNVVTGSLESLHNQLTNPLFNSDSGLVYSPIMDTKLTLDGIELTQEESTAVMDGLTFMLFDYLKNRDAEAFFIENIDLNEAYSHARKKLDERLYKLGKGLKDGYEEDTKRMLKLFGSNSTQFNEYLDGAEQIEEEIKRLGQIRKALFMTSYGDNNWNKVKIRHSDRLRSYGFSFDADEVFADETELVKDREFNRVEGEINEKDKIPPAVKLWIATRARSGKNNMLNFPELLDFNDSYNFIIDKLAGLPASGDIMLSKLEQLKNSFAKTKEESKNLTLYRKARYDLLDSVLEPDSVFYKLMNPKNTTLHEFKLRNQIVQTFSKQKPVFFVGQIQDNGDITFYNSNQNKSSDVILREWESAYNEKLESLPTGKFLPISTVNNLKAKLKAITSKPFDRATDSEIKELVDALKSVGITISDFKQVNDKLIVTTNRSLLTLISEAIIDNGFNKQIENENTEYLPLEYNLIKDKNIAGSIKMLAEIEADINTVMVNNQFQSADNQVNYGIILNHFLSLNTNNLNYWVANTNEKNRMAVLQKEMPHLFHIMNGNSVLKERLIKEGLTVQNSLFNGLKQHSDPNGRGIRDLGEANRWAMLIASTMAKNPIYTFYRAADRTTESGYRFVDKSGVPVKIFESDENMNGIANKMIGYLKDELKTMYYSYHNGLGKELMHYEKNSKKNGKPTFKYFSDDKLIFNKYQDNHIDYDTILQYAIINSKKLKTEKAIDAFIDSLITPEVSTNLQTAFRQYFQRKAFGHYYNGINKESSEIVKPTNLKQARKDYKESVKGRLESLGLLAVVDAPVEQVFENGYYIDKELPREGKYFAGISSDIFRRYIGYGFSYNNQQQVDWALESLLEDFEAIQFGAYVEIGKVFVGDPTMFKNQDDYFKRMAMYNSTKKVSIVDDTFNNILNTQNTGKLFVEHNGYKVKLNNIELTTDDVNKGLSYIKTKYADKIKENIEAYSFLDATAMNKVELELDMGYKKYNYEWKNTFTSVIFDDIKSASSLAFEDSVTNIRASGGIPTYYDEEGNVVEASKVSPLTKLFTESFINDGITDTIALSNKVMSYIKNYRGYDESDGQAYATLDGYKEILMRAGDWTDKHHNAYSKIMQGIDLTAEDMMLFPILKTQYTGPLSNTGNLFVPAGYKHSVFPLIPQVVKGTKLEQLKDFMEENNISLANMNSANKYGTIRNAENQIMTLYDENGEFTWDKAKSKLNGRNLITQDTNWKWFGIQVDQAPKLKGKITVGSQFRKLALSNLMNNGVPIDYTGTKDWSELSLEEKITGSNVFAIQHEYITIQGELIERAYDDLAEKLGLEPIVTGDEITGYVIKNRDALIDIIVESEKDRSIPDNVIVSLNLLRDEENFIEQISNKDKVEQIMHALVNSRVIREKRKGEMSPQVASSLFEFQKDSISVTDGYRSINVGSGKSVKIKSALKTYRKGFNGETLPAEAMISLPKEWIGWVNDVFGNLDGFNKALDELHNKLYQIEEQGKPIGLSPDEIQLKNLITLIGFRIPNQGLNSADYMRVRRFLPTQAGGTITVPSEMIPKAGSDYDIDKLNIYLAHSNKPKKTKTGWIMPGYINYYGKSSNLDTRYNNYVDSQSLDKLKENEQEELGITQQKRSLENALNSFKEEKSTIAGDLVRTKESIKANLEYIKENKTAADIIQNNLESNLALSSDIWKDLPKVVKNVIKKAHRTTKDGVENFIWTIRESDNMIDNIDLVYSDLSNAEKEIYESAEDLKDVLEIFRNATENAMNNLASLRPIIEAYNELKNLKKDKKEFIEELSDLYDDFADEKDSIRNQIKNIIRNYKIEKLGLLSKAEFNRLPIEKQNTEEALQNRMLELQVELLKHPANLRQLMSPITDAVLNDEDNGIVWDTRFMQSNNEVFLDKNKDGDLIAKYGKDKLVPSVELLKRKEQILDSIVYSNKASNIINLSNIKGYINVNGELVENPEEAAELVRTGKLNVNNIQLTDMKLLDYMGQVAVEYNDLRKLWYNKTSSVFKEGTFAQVTSSVTNMNKFIEFITGKTGGVGQTAVHITHHQLSTAVDLYLNTKEPLWVFTHNVNKDGYPSFAKTNGTDGELISETLSAFLNAYVDVAKDPYIFSINAGSQTANMIFMMIRAGAPIKWIGRFLSQPIIKDYVRMQSSNESMPIKASGLEITDKKELVKKVTALYGDDPKSPKVMMHQIRASYDSKRDSLFDEADINGTLDELPPYNFTEADEGNEKEIERMKKMQNAGLFSYEKLGEYISYNSFNSEEGAVPEQLKHIDDYYNKAQLMLLDLFLEYQRQSKHFQELIRATSADTKGIPQNRNTLESSINVTKKVMRSQMYGNAEKLIEDTIVKKFNETRLNTLKMYTPMYLVEQEPMLKKTVKKLQKLYSPFIKDGKKRENFFTTISNDLLMALMSIDYNDGSNPTKDVYQELFVASSRSKYNNKEGAPISFPEFINQLNDKKAKRDTSSEQVQKYWKLRDNKFIAKLIGYTSNTPLTYEQFTKKTQITVAKPNVNYLRFNKGKIIQEEANLYSEQLQAIKESFPEFYDDLIKFAMWQTGFNNNANSFIGDIPAVDVFKYKTDAINRFLSLNEEQQENLLDQFTSQFKRRNLQFNPGIKRLTKDVASKKDPNKKRKLSSAKSTDSYIDIDPETGEEVVINKFSYSQFEFLVGTTRDKKTGQVIRYATTGTLGDDGYMKFNTKTDRKYPIVGEEMYFTGYELKLLTPEEAGNRVAKKSELVEKTKEKTIISEKVESIYSALGDKTQSKFVEIPGIGELKDVQYNGKNFWTEILSEARAQFGDQLIFAYRGKKDNSFTQNYKGKLTEDPAAIIGNPFDFADEKGTRKEQGMISTKKFIEWMITGNNFGNKNATEEYRQAIITDIKNGKLKGRPIIYYQEKGYATHATAIDYLVNDYNWDDSTEVYMPDKPRRISTSEIKGIEISSKEKGLGNDLTNVHYAVNGKSKFDIVPSDKSLVLTQEAESTWGRSVEAWYKSNNAKAKGIPEGSKGDEHDMKLMTELIRDKFEQYPELVKQVEENGGTEFLRKSTHSIGKGRWSSKNPKNMFIKALVAGYESYKVPFSPFITENIEDKAQDIASKWIEDSNCKR